MALPTAEACAGRTTPVRLPTRTDRGLSAQSMKRTVVPSRTARLTVSWVSSRICSRTGRATRRMSIRLTAASPISYSAGPGR
jgi:hypothetical protein